MGRDLKGKELGVGISQRSDGFYVGRFTTKYGQRKQKLFRKLQECRQWLRTGELVGLKWSDIDFDNRTLTISRSMEYCHSTGELESLRVNQGGMKPKILQTILGHSNIGITMNLYVHVTDEEKEKEVQGIEKCLKSSKIGVVKI